MTRKALKTAITIFSALLAAELLFLGFLFVTGREDTVPVMADPTTAATTLAPSTAATTFPTETTLPPTTAAPTETTVPPTTQPEQLSFTLTFVGDCTLGSEPGKFSSPHSFVGTVGEDYDYPFAHVREYFEQDDLTFINLESVLSDDGSALNKLFTFRGPTAYTQILTGSSVEAVTLANNHTLDFGQEGYDSTKQALEEAGVSYVEEDKTCLITTEGGLVVGLYADSFYFSTGEIAANVKNLRDAGADIIVCAFHWGTEGSYRYTAAQEKYAKAAIDAGADIVWGHHPHVLQEIVQYGDGVILYSLGNFSFGGNHFPRDHDSAIVQQEILRNADGTFSLGEMTIIPVAISSISGQNNFQPIPYEEGTAQYDRAMSKLNGTFTGPDLVVNYDNLTTPPTTVPAETAPPETQAPQATTPPATTPAAPETPAPPETQAPAPTQPPAPPENSDTTG